MTPKKILFSHWMQTVECLAACRFRQKPWIPRFLNLSKQKIFSEVFLTYSVQIVVKKIQKCRIFKKCENFTSFVFSAMPQPRNEGSKLVSQSKSKN